MNIKENILEQLSIDSEYYDGIGRNYLSNSHIDDMMRTPDWFIKFMKGDVSGGFNTNFVVGNAAHTLVLEGKESYADKYSVLLDAKGEPINSRNATIYKKHEDKTSVLMASEDAMVRRLSDKLNLLADVHEDIFNLVTPFIGEVEVPQLLKLHGVDWKMKADKVTDDFIYDLKTTSDISKFIYSAKKYNYDSQAALYSQAFGKEMKFIVVDKKTLEVAVVDCDDSFLANGEIKLEEASEFFKTYIKPALADGDYTKVKNLCNYFTLT